MFDRVKLALRLTTEAYDDEINDLIAGALSDLNIAGINCAGNDPAIVRAVVTFCRFSFGTPDDYDRLKASYDEQKAQLQMATGYGFALEA